MLVKTGVTSLDSLQKDRSILGFPKRFALHLYGEIVESRPDLDAWLPRILARHQTHAGAFKRTSNRRFERLDAIVAEEFARRRAHWDAPPRVHDLGVSDGRSSVELLDRLRASGPVDFTASDRDTRVDVVRSPSGRWAVAFDEDGEAVQYVGGRLVLSPVAPESALLYPLNRLALAWLRSRHLAPAAAVRRETTASGPLADLERREVRGHTVFRVPLVCRACLEHVGKGEMRFVRHDLRDPLPGRHHLLRAMNVLNHLDAEQRARALGRLRDGLEEGGLLVVGRSADPSGETRATVWCRAGRGLQALHTLHGGSELTREVESGFHPGRGSTASGARP